MRPKRPKLYLYIPLDETLLWQPQIYPLIEHYTDEAQKAETVPSVYIVIYNYYILKNLHLYSQSVYSTSLKLDMF